MSQKQLELQNWPFKCRYISVKATNWWDFSWMWSILPRHAQRGILKLNGNPLSCNLFFPCLTVGKLVYCLWCINSFLCQTSICVESTKAPLWMVLSRKIFKICACRFLRNAIPGPVLRFLCNFFSKLFLFLMDGFKEFIYS